LLRQQISHNIIFVVVVLVIIADIFVFVVLLVVSLSASLVAVVGVLLSVTGLVDYHTYIYLKVDCCYHFLAVHVSMFQ
jgi:hypothetical protein